MVHELLPNTTLATSALSDLGYSKPAIAEVLSDLAMAGLLEKWRRGNRDYYELARRNALLDLVGHVLPATAPNWAMRFRIVAGLVAAEAATREKKPVVQAVAILKQLEHHHEVLERLGVKPPAGAQIWPDLASWARHALLDERAPPSDPPVDEPNTARLRFRRNATG
jgi:DNA-binding transcriptional ArsR family regulator